MAAVTWSYAKKSRSGYRPQNVGLSATGTAQTLIDAPGSGYRTVLDKVILTVDAAGALSVFVSSDETGNRLVYNDFAQYGGLLDGQLDGVALPENQALKATFSAGNVKFTAFYHVEPVR